MEPKNIGMKSAWEAHQHDMLRGLGYACDINHPTDDPETIALWKQTATKLGLTYIDREETEATE
ncbi:hypothetical protein ON05_031380 (plasmid) [Acaryochloris sp. CCMEE 5410]|nr:hypothetical protein ON05_031380 [Acaryochloris sp. CCMEE 5410]